MFIFPDNKPVRLQGGGDYHNRPVNLSLVTTFGKATIRPKGSDTDIPVIRFSHVESKNYITDWMYNSIEDRDMAYLHICNDVKRREGNMP